MGYATLDARITTMPLIRPSTIRFKDNDKVTKQHAQQLFLPAPVADQRNLCSISLILHIFSTSVLCANLQRALQHVVVRRNATRRTGYVSRFADCQANTLVKMRGKFKVLAEAAAPSDDKTTRTVFTSSAWQRVT